MATRQFNIFVEGNDDHDLIVALLQDLKSVSPDLTKKNKRPTTYWELQPSGDKLVVLATNGWTQLIDSAPLFQQARDSGGRNLIVFDADYDEPNYPNGGHINRTTVIRAAVAPFDASPELFLFPRPGQDGNLETLLLQLTQPAHQRVLDCYDGYETCLSRFLNATGEPYYNAPSNKRRIYDYVNVMPMSPELWQRHHEKGGQKIFENADWWNLTAPAIQPLRDFLDRHIP